MKTGSFGWWIGVVIVALLALALLGPVADDTLVNAGASFDGVPPPCRADRVGIVLTLQGTRSVCLATSSGYEWRPAR